MSVRVVVAFAWVFASVLALGAGVLTSSGALAEELGPEQARAFVVGKLFSYTCFEGTVGMGRIFPDGSVVGTIRIRGQGEQRFATLPAGTIRVEGTSMCAHLSNLPISPCFRVQKIDYRSFRGSIAGLGFAYCDFYQHNQRSRLVSGQPQSPATTTVANTAPQSPAATTVANTVLPEPPAATPVANTVLPEPPAATSVANTVLPEPPAATPVANTVPQSLRPAIEE